MGQQYTLEEDRIIWRSADTKSFGEIGKQLGKTRHQIRGRLLQLDVEFQRWLEQLHDEAGTKRLTSELTDNEQVLTCIDPDIKTVPELIEHCKIDLTVWKIDKAVVNKWGGFARTRSYKKAEDDWRRELSKVALFQVKVWLSRIDRETTANAELRKQLIAELDKHSPHYPPIKASMIPSAGRVMGEISIPDHHFAKLCWNEETNWGNYDLKIAESMYITAVVDLLKKLKGYNIEKILFPIGNDMLHVDGASNETSNGTRQDVDGRWQKAFLVAKRSIIQAIDLCRPIAPVEILVVPGNHDLERSFYLGDTIQSHYRLDKRVQVNNRPTQCKFIEYGKTLLGFTHGDTISEGELPMIMASGAKDAFARTEHHEWHLGHRHTRQHKQFAPRTFKPQEGVKVSGGVHIRILPALCAPDAWHTKQGYVLSPRASEAYIWSRDEGYAGHLVHNPKLPDKKIA